MFSNPDNHDLPQLKLLSRAIKLDSIKNYKVQEMLQEINWVFQLSTQHKFLLPLQGAYFDPQSQILQIYMPQRVSLHTVLHSANYQPLSALDKQLIATNLAKALLLLNKLKPGEVLAHSHITSKNVFVNLTDFSVEIGDFGLPSLKKYCKLFHNYINFSNWSAPEIWQAQFKN